MPSVDAVCCHNFEALSENSICRRSPSQCQICPLLLIDSYSHRSFFQVNSHSCAQPPTFQSCSRLARRTHTYLSLRIFPHVCSSLPPATGLEGGVNILVQFTSVTSTNKAPSLSPLALSTPQSHFYPPHSETLLSYCCFPYS